MLATAGFLPLREDADLTRVLEGAVQTLMVGVTFALIVLAINTFKHQKEIQETRAEAERLVHDHRTELSRCREVVEHGERTLGSFYAVLNILSAPRKVAAEGAFFTHREVEAFKRASTEMYWERKLLLIILSNDPQTQIKECRDIIGSMEGRLRGSDLPLVDRIEEALHSVIGRVPPPEENAAETRRLRRAARRLFRELVAVVDRAGLTRAS